MLACRLQFYPAMKCLVTIFVVFISLTAVTAALAITEVAVAPVQEPLLLILAGTVFLVIALLGLFDWKRWF